MKRFLLLVLLCLGTSVASAQLPPSPAPTPKKHSLSLDAQSVASGGLAKLLTDTQVSVLGANPVAGGTPVPVKVTDLYDKQLTGNRTNLQISVRNFQAAADTVTVEWYFLAMPVGVTASKVPVREFVFDKGSQEVTVAPGIVNSYLVGSKELTSSVSRATTIVSSTNSSSTITYMNGSNAVGSSTTEGLKVKGWCVRILENGRVLASRGSSQTYEDIAKDDEKLRQLFLASPNAQRPGIPAR